MENVQLCCRIQILRKQMGYSQKSFAEFLNIPQPSISAYENGKNSPTIDVLINILPNRYPVHHQMYVLITTLVDAFALIFYFMMAQKLLNI